MTFTRLIDINTDIRDAYGEARAKMEAVELMHGVLITRGASLSYKAALKQVMTEPGAGPSDMVDWPVRATQAAAFISDLEREYLKLYRHEGYGIKARDAVGDAAGALETLADLILNAAREEKAPEAGLSLMDYNIGLRDACLEAIEKVNASAAAVEEARGPENVQAYSRLLEETCTRKDKGYRTLLESPRQLIAAKTVIEGVREEYRQMRQDGHGFISERPITSALIALDDLISILERATSRKDREEDWDDDWGDE
nr:MAG TPA: hypothetical protein [Siphoviridae sp. ctcOR4]